MHPEPNLPILPLMKPIFEYIDYRKFLADYYHTKKENSRFFSYRYFSQKTGLNSPSFLKAVIDGKRNLTRQMAERFCKALNLSLKETMYFCNLVLFNQAKTSSEKQEHYMVLRSMVGLVKESVLNADQYDYFANWYTSVIRELICLYDFKQDYQLLADMVKPAISQSEAKSAVNLLLKLKLVETGSNGIYQQTAKAIVADSSIQSIGTRSFMRAMIEHSKSALDTFDRNERHISGITMGISPEAYDVLAAEIEAFKDRIKVIVNNDSGSNRIYQMNIALFPTSDQIPSQTNQNRGKQ